MKFPRLPNSVSRKEESFYNHKSQRAASVTGGVLPPDPTLLSLPAGGTIHVGDVVRVSTVDDAAVAFKLKPLKEYIGAIAGIAENSANAGEPVSIRVSGIASVPEQLLAGALPGAAVFARHSPSSANLSLTPLTTPSTNETAYVRVGTVTNTNTVAIDFRLFGVS